MDQSFHLIQCAVSALPSQAFWCLSFASFSGASASFFFAEKHLKKNSVRSLFQFERKHFTHTSLKENCQDTCRGIPMWSVSRSPSRLFLSVSSSSLSFSSCSFRSCNEGNWYWMKWTISFDTDRPRKAFACPAPCYGVVVSGCDQLLFRLFLSDHYELVSVLDVLEQT